MSYVPHSWSKKITDSLLRKLAAADPRLDLTEEEMARLVPRVKQFDRRSVALVLVSAALFAVIITMACWKIRMAMEAPVVDAIFDNRAPIGFAVTGLMFGICGAIVPYRLYVRRYWAGEEELFYRYKGTRTGHDERKALRYAVVLHAVIGLFGVILGINIGEVVDANGIRYGSGLLGRYQRPYSEVTSVGLYDQHDAPIGVQNNFNLEICFKDGPSWRLLSNQGNCRPEILERIARYVGEKGGVAVSRGMCRP